MNALFRHQIVANNDAFCRADVFLVKPRPSPPPVAAGRGSRGRRASPEHQLNRSACGTRAPPCVTGLPLFTAVCVTMFANRADAAGAAADEDAPAAAAAGAADQDARGLPPAAASAGGGAGPWRR